MKTAVMNLMNSQFQQEHDSVIDAIETVIDSDFRHDCCRTI